MTDYDLIKDKAKKLWSTFAPFETVTFMAFVIFSLWEIIRFDMGFSTRISSFLIRGRAPYFRLSIFFY